MLDVSPRALPDPPRRGRGVIARLAVGLGLACGGGWSVACGGSDAPTGAEAAAGASQGLPSLPAGHVEAPGSAVVDEVDAVDTEVALVLALAGAIERRDLASLQALTAPELAADMRRLHDAGPADFWRRGMAWSVNAGTGVSVAHRQETQGDRWRALLRFGNDEEETVVFTRIGGRLRFEQL